MLTTVLTHLVIQRKYLDNIHLKMTTLMNVNINDLFGKTGKITEEQKQHIIGVYCLVGKNGNENRYDLMGVPDFEKQEFSIIKYNPETHHTFLYVELGTKMQGGMKIRRNATKRHIKQSTTQRRYYK